MFKRKTYQANQRGPHAFDNKGPNAPQWYLVDAGDLTLGRLATVLTRTITGKHKVRYTPHADTGDFVVVINAEKIALTGNSKWTDKKYYHHTQWMGGLKTVTAEELRNKKPTDLIKKAVWGMTNKSTLAKRQLKKLKIYAGGEHPHEAHKPQPLPNVVTRKTILSGVKELNG